MINFDTVQIYVYRETSIKLMTDNKIIPEGIVVQEIDTNCIKIGDGLTHYNSLDKVVDKIISEELFNILDKANTPNGVVVLNSEGKITRTFEYDATITSKGIVQLSSSVTSNSESVAATSNAVRVVKDALDDLVNMYTGHEHSASSITAGILNSERLPAATTAVQGAVILSQLVTGTSNMKAATESAVKQAMDRADSAYTLAGSKANISHTHPSNEITVGATPIPAGALPSATTTAPGIVQLNNTLNNSSQTHAPTANALKTVNDDLQNYKSHSHDVVYVTEYDVQQILAGSMISPAAGGAVISTIEGGTSLIRRDVATMLGTGSNPYVDFSLVLPSNFQTGQTFGCKIFWYPNADETVGHTVAMQVNSVSTKSGSPYIDTLTNTVVGRQAVVSLANMHVITIPNITVNGNIGADGIVYFRLTRLVGDSVLGTASYKQMNILGVSIQYPIYAKIAKWT